MYENSAPVTALNTNAPTDVEDLDFAPVVVGGFYLKAKGASAEMTVARPSNHKVESLVFDATITGKGVPKKRVPHTGETGTSYTTMDILLRGDTTPRPMELSTFHWALISQEIKAQVAKLTGVEVGKVKNHLQGYWFEVTKTEHGYSVTVTEPVGA